MDSEEDSTFRVGVILKGVASPTEKSQTLLSQFATMAKSLIRNLESRKGISRSGHQHFSFLCLIEITS